MYLHLAWTEFFSLLGVLSSERSTGTRSGTSPLLRYPSLRKTCTLLAYFHIVPTHQWREPRFQPTHFPASPSHSVPVTADELSRVWPQPAGPTKPGVIRCGLQDGSTQPWHPDTPHTQRPSPAAARKRTWWCMVLGITTPLCLPCSEPTRRKHLFLCDERGGTGEIVFGIESEWSRTRIHRFI
jgi:hypothetical protein